MRTLLSESMGMGGGIPWGDGLAMRYEASIQVSQRLVFGGIIYYLSLGNQRGFLQKNRNVADNVSTYESTESVHY
jgi:hypothetical protein